MRPFKRILSNLSAKPNPVSFDDLLSYSETSITSVEVAELAKVLAESGSLLNYDNPGKILADIPSTGGPSSLSTLITPLFLKQEGYLIPKLGIPGRPAGGIDVLAQIKGYNINPDQRTIKNWLSESGYVHFVGGARYTPLDRKLFKYRIFKDKVGVAPLIVASILSKKIAVGLHKVGLDIRVSQFGNFGKDWNSAKKNAKFFIEVAEILNIKATCFLTNAMQPFQPYIGRGESLLAIDEFFSGNMNSLCLNHITECYAMARGLSGKSATDDPSFNVSKLEKDFFENVVLQGGSIEGFKEVVKTIKEHHSYRLHSNRSGFVNVDLLQIRSAILEIQSKTGVSSILFPDPCGIILTVRHGDFIDKGTILCSYRCENHFQSVFKQLLEQSISVSDSRDIYYKFEKI